MQLTNYSDQIVRIERGSSDCSCLTVKDLPIEIAPKSGRSLTVSIRYVGSPGIFRKHLTLYAVDERVHVMPLAVSGILPK
ncbi:MAG: DUF1573 domain-containing protein [Gemmataceae bacterium]